jgi:hypothetical protein
MAVVLRSTAPNNMMRKMGEKLLSFQTTAIHSLSKDPNLTPAARNMTRIEELMRIGDGHKRNDFFHLHGWTFCCNVNGITNRWSMSSSKESDIVVILFVLLFYYVFNDYHACRTPSHGENHNIFQLVVHFHSFNP